MKTRKFARHKRLVNGALVFRLWLLASLAAASLGACGSDAEVGDSNGNGVGNGDGDGDGGVGEDAGMDPGNIFDLDGGDPLGGDGDGDGDGDGTGDSGTIPTQDYPDANFSYTPPLEEASTCASVTGTATLTKKPVDIIISVDNSSSMSQEIEAIQDRINTDFAQKIGDSGIDYRVILVSRYGYVNSSEDLGETDNPICIGAPLGAAACVDDNYPMLELNDPFFHHSTDIESRDMLCKLLRSYDEADEIGDNLGTRDNITWSALAPNGWSEWLREDALKVFIGITDDDPNADACSGVDDDFSDSEAGADAFDLALRTLAPNQFGAPGGERNYIWHSIIGIDAKAPVNIGDPPPAYEPAEDVVGTECEDNGNTSDGIGTGYQWLSKKTGGLRYSSCYTSNFDAVFDRIAEGVIEGAGIECDFAIPEVEQEINYENINVFYLEGGSAANAQAFVRVADASACSANNQYYLAGAGSALDGGIADAAVDAGSEPSRVFLCADTCALVQADPAADIEIDFGCLGQ